MMHGPTHLKKGFTGFIEEVTVQYRAVAPIKNTCYKVKLKRGKENIMLKLRIPSLNSGFSTTQNASISRTSTSIQ